MPDNVLTVRFAGGGGGGTGGGGGSIGSSATAEAHDPAAIAARRIEREGRAQQVQEQYNNLKFGQFGGGLANLASKAGLPNPVVGLTGRLASTLGPLGLIAGLGAGAGFAAHHFTSGLADKHANLGFSPDVAMAKAGQDVARTTRDIREANTLGPSLAKFMEAQTSIQNSIAEMLLPIKEVVVDVMAFIMKQIAAFLKEVRDVMVEWGWLKKQEEDPVVKMLDDFLAMEIPGFQNAAAQLDGLMGVRQRNAAAGAAERKLGIMLPGF